MCALHKFIVKPGELSLKAVENWFAQSINLKEADMNESLNKYKIPVNKRASLQINNKKTIAQKGNWL